MQRSSGQECLLIGTHFADVYVFVIKERTKLMPEAGTDYEQLLLNEIRIFPESYLPNLLKMVSL